MVNNIRTNFVLTLIFASFTFGQFQTPDQNANILEPIFNITRGIEKSAEWYDIPIYMAYLARDGVTSRNFGDKIFARPMKVEKELANQFSGSSESLGSMDKDLIPDAIFYSRLGVTFTLDLFTNANIDGSSYQKIFIFKKSLLYTYVLTEYIKSLVKRTRPDGTDDRSFFSGHTSTTFAAATFLYKELHDVYNDWNYLDKKPFLRGLTETITFGTLYGWASYVGYSRIHDKKHYLSDVIVGAIVGTAISYFVYEGYFGNDNCFLSNFSLRALDKDLAINFRLDLQ